MVEQELGGNIVLSNFDLDVQEMVIAKKIIGNYAKKIRNFQEYQELKVEMKTHEKGKGKTFEIKAKLLLNGENLNSEKQGYNVFVLLNEVMEKVLNEVEHKTRK